MGLRSLPVRFWAPTGLALLVLGLGTWDLGGRTFPLQVCFQELPGDLRGLPLVWRGTPIGRVTHLESPAGRRRCAWVVLRVQNIYRGRIPVGSVIYVHPGRSLELVVLDPGSPALRSWTALPGRPDTAAPIERAWIDRLQRYRDLCSAWIRGFHRWVHSGQAPTDLARARRELLEGLEQRSVLGPCLSWTERRLIYTLLRQWMDLRDGLQGYGYAPSELDPLIRRLYDLWADPTCDSHGKL